MYQASGVYAAYFKSGRLNRFFEQRGGQVRWEWQLQRKLLPLPQVLRVYVPAIFIQWILTEWWAMTAQRIWPLICTITSWIIHISQIQRNLFLLLTIMYRPTIRRQPPPRRRWEILPEKTVLISGKEKVSATRSWWRTMSVQENWFSVQTAIHVLTVP